MKRIYQVVVISILILCLGAASFAQSTKAQRNLRKIQVYVNEHPAEAVQTILQTIKNTAVAGLTDPQRTALSKALKKNLLAKVRGDNRDLNKVRATLQPFLDAYEEEIGSASSIADLLLLIATPTQTFTVTPTPTPTTTSTPTATP